MNTLPDMASRNLVFFLLVDSVWESSLAYVTYSFLHQLAGVATCMPGPSPPRPAPRHWPGRVPYLSLALSLLQGGGQQPSLPFPSLRFPSALLVATSHQNIIILALQSGSSYGVDDKHAATLITLHHYRRYQFHCEHFCCLPLPLHQCRFPPAAATRQDCGVPIGSNNKQGEQEGEPVCVRSGGGIGRVQVEWRRGRGEQ